MSDDATTVTLDEAKVLQSETDWDALKEKTDEEIREAVESDPDAYFLDEDWFEAATFGSLRSEGAHFHSPRQGHPGVFPGGGTRAIRAVSTRCSGSTWPSGSMKSKNVKKGRGAHRFGLRRTGGSEARRLL